MGLPVMLKFGSSAGDVVGMTRAGSLGVLSFSVPGKQQHELLQKTWAGHLHEQVMEKINVKAASLVWRIGAAAFAAEGL